MKFSLHLNVFLVAAVVFALSVSAHGIGQKFEKEAGPYLVDIGSNTLTFRAGDIIALDFNILEKETRQNAEFTDIWMRIEKENKIFVAGGLSKARFGGTFLSYVFPEAGEYKLFVRFQNGEEVLAEMEFPLVVEERKNQQSGFSGFYSVVLSFILGGVMSAGTMLFFRKKQV